jgi:exodeoxyribonuclease V alpha subunit
METISGVVERTTYYNPENTYAVIKIMPDKRIADAQARDGTVTVIGFMPELGDGEKVELSGEWVNDPKYGKQFRAAMITPIMPDTLEGLVKFLSSGLVSGIGEATAKRIVDHFGHDTQHVLNEEPGRLYEILKPKLAEALARAWQDNVAVRQVMIFLQQYGVSAKMGQRIYGYYGSDAIAKVKSNPYILADEVFGIGFTRADQIAVRMGLARESRERIRAGLTYALNELARDGHSFAPRGLLIDKTAELLGIDGEALRPRISAALDGQITSRDLIEDDLRYGAEEEAGAAIYLPLYHTAERRSAELLLAHTREPSQIMRDVEGTDWPRFLASLLDSGDVSLTEQQQDAVRAALTGKVTVLTGGPGTGKTTTLKLVITALEQGSYSYRLASPTGRAAKRLSEATGRDAFTIHRLLGYSPADGWSYDEDNPLDAQFVIVDESSMIDLLLFYQLVRSLRPDAHLLLVGDVDQLPSVGAGNVLRDVIDSGVAYVTRLKVIFRQSEQSQIVTNAHRINQGESPHLDNRGSDFFFFAPGKDRDDENIAEWTANMILEVVTRRLPEKFGVDPLNDVQVIAPMYRGVAGVTALNERLQEALNGDKRLAQRKIAGGRVLRVGDKVMQTRNNYEKEVFNGDIGRIQAIDLDEGVFEVIIDNRYVIYDFTEAEELIHAFCISTHRSQGSEYAVVVMPILTQHYMMLQRNLLYTAITRARRVVVLVGDRKAVYMAVNNNKVAQRFSGLLPRLRRD